MLKEQCRVGMKVIFGRYNGEKTLGEVVKCNPAKAKVKLLEDRGNGRGSEVGSTWIVPYSMMEPVQAEIREPIRFNPFLPDEDQHILQAIHSCYVSLSPENLHQDGERSHAAAMQEARTLRNKLKHLFAALGREVSETEAYEWNKQWLAYCERLREDLKRA